MHIAAPRNTLCPTRYYKTRVAPLGTHVEQKQVINNITSDNDDDDKNE